MKRTVGRILTAIGIIGFLSCAGILVHGTLHVFDTRKGTPTLEKIASHIGVDLPPGTRLIKGYYEGWQEYEYFAILEFDAKYTQAFVKSIPAKSDIGTETIISRTDRLGLSNTGSPVDRTKNPAWWNPDSVHKFIAVYYGAPTCPAYLLISLDDPTRTRVYVYTFTT